MEERVPPATPNDDHQHQRHKEAEQGEEFDDYYNIDNNDDKNNNNNNKKADKDKVDEIVRIVSSKTGETPNNQRKPHATYIIQVPKDQIYRVPPPENAEIVEKYRNPVQQNQQGRQRCMYWCLSIFFVVAFLISLIVCVHHFTLKPKNPSFSVKHFVVKQPPPSSKKNTGPKFQVSLQTKNPNSVNDIGHQQGSAKLAYKGKEIGHGSFPALENEKSGKSDAVDVLITGLSKDKLPKELQSQPTNKRAKPVNLNLNMNIPLKLKTWLFTKKVNVDVGCTFEVDSMGENIKVLSQKCDIQ